MVLRARDCGVQLHNAEERAKWKALAKLNYRVSKFPCPVALNQLGLSQCFEELCQQGQLSVLFMGDNISSYQVLTLEFLSTLEVVMNRRAIASIKFRLRNDPYEMTMEAFKDMHGFTANDFSEPAAFDRNAFWRAITGLDENFQANRAKGSKIRNPVLRMIQKACVGHPFARSQQGSVQRDELFLLWSILYKRPINLGHYMIKHLQRTAKKTTGTLCCGGVIGSIALHLGVATEDLVKDMGESLMDFDYLKRTGFIAVDRRRRAYLLQKAEDHFPLPDAPNTYVNGPEFTINWAMNSDVHRAAIAARPPALPWQSYNPCSWNADNIPHVDVPEHLLEAEQEGEDNEEGNDEEMPQQQDANEAGPSNPRRRGREERLEQDIASINERIGPGSGMHQLSDCQEAHWAQNEAYWTQFNARYEEQWANFNARFDGFRGYWQHPPPPPQP